MVFPMKIFYYIGLVQHIAEIEIRMAVGLCSLSEKIFFQT